MAAVWDILEQEKKLILESLFEDRLLLKLGITKCPRCLERFEKNFNIDEATELVFTTCAVCNFSYCQ